MNMNKIFTTSFLAIVFFLLSISSQAQVQFKVELLANDLYQVSLRSDEIWENPLNITNSGTVTLVAPTGGFDISTVTDISGNWDRINHIVAPSENSSMDYFVFTLQSGTSDIVYHPTHTSTLFSFTNDLNDCGGPIELIHNDNDPFVDNDQNILVGNQITVLGAGPGENAYTRNYSVGSADCSNEVSATCGITIINVLKTSPSTCGAMDGVIEIIAEQNGTLPPLQYSIDGGLDWQSEPVFPELAAGDDQEILVRDMAAICLNDEWGIEVLDAPLAAAIRRVDVTDPSTCGGTNGSFFISAFNEFGDELEFSADGGTTWSLDSLISDLPAGTYNLVVRNNVNGCISPIGEYFLTEDCNNQNNCLFDFEIEEVSNGIYEVSLTPYNSYVFPSNITSTAQVTMKVPTGGFVLSGLESLIEDVNFQQNSRYDAPEEDTNFDYITIGLAQSTMNIPYQQGQKVPLFTFENTGSCSGDSIFLMNNESDPFFPLNSENAGVGMQITTVGSGADAPICLPNNGATTCSGPDVMCTDVEAGENEDICEDGEVQLEATSGTGDYVWSPTTGLSCTHCPNPVANPSSTTTYTVNSDDGTCMSSDMVTVTVLEAPKPDFFAESPCDGEAAAFSASTNNPSNNLSWLWDFDDNGETSTLQNPTYTFSGPGQYLVTLTVTESGQCTGSASKMITVYPSVTADAGEDVTICGGGTGQLTASGGTQYTWSPTEGLSCSDCPNPVASPASTMTYTVFVSNDDGCSSSDVVRVNVGTGVAISTVNSIAPSDCSSGGSIEIIATCSDDCAIEYSIDNGQTWSDNNTFDNLTANQYNVQVRVANTDCTSTYAENPVNISTADSPQISEVTATNPSTCGSNTGSITIAANCNDACTLEYSINNGQDWFNTATFDELAAGEYQIQVRVENSDCVSFYVNNPVSIAGGDAPQIDEVTSTNPSSCEGGSGSITITATCVDACVLEYSIDNGQNWSNTATFNDLTPGSYHVRFRVENSDCISSYINNPVQILAANSPQIDEVSTTDPSTCGANDGTITISASGGTAPLQYSIDGGNNFQDSPEFINLFPAAYSVVVANSDENCPVAFNDAVIINPTGLNNDIAVEANSPSDCELSDGRIVITTSPADNIEYSIDNGQTWVLTPVFDNLAAGSYQVRIRMVDGFCSADFENNPVVLTQANPPNVLTPLDEFTTCEHVTVPIEIVVSEAIDSFRVYGSGGYVNDVLNGTSLTFDAVATDETSDFHVELYGTSGCSVTESFEVFRIDAPTADFEISEPVCTGGETTITFTGMASPSAILDWSLDGATLLSSSPASADAPQGAVLTIRWTEQGNKNVQLFVQDGQCEAMMDEDISVIPFPIAVNTSTEAVSSCGANDGAITLEILNDENYSFVWSGPNNFSAMTQNIDNLIGGNYTVVITDTEGGCTLTLEATVEEPSDVFIGNVMTVNDASCNAASGQVTLTANGGVAPYTFELLENGTSIAMEVTFDDTYTFEQLSAGDYTLQVKDLNNCSDNATISINGGSSNPPSVTITDVEASACGTANGSITADVTGAGIAYTYELFRNVTSIAQGDLPFSNQIVFNDLDPATYTVIITDNNSCSSSEEVTIESEAADFEVDAAIIAPSCDEDNGSISLSNFPDNADFNWATADGMTLANSPNVDNLAAGIYFVTVAGGNGCSQFFNYNLVPADGPQVIIQDIRDIVCGGVNSGAIFFEVQSEGTFSYDIMGEDIDGTITGNTLDSIVNLSAGAYTLNVTDTNNNCTSSSSFFIDSGNALQVVATLSPATECYVFDGSVCLTISGGEAPYTIETDNGTAPTEPIFSTACVEGLYSGSVDVRVFDVNGCSEIFRLVFNDVPTCADTLIATIPTGESTELCLDDLIQLPGDIMEANICNQNEAQIDINLEGVATCIDVSPVEGFIGTAETICIIHCQDILDNNYCDTTFINILVEEVACELAVEGRITNEATCGAANGSANLEVIGNVGTLQYNWTDDLPNSNSLENLAEGTYYVTITDDMTDCVLMDSITINNIPGATLSLSAQPASCDNGGAILATISGGTAPYSIQWSGAAIGSFTDVTSPFEMTDLPAGDYEVEILDNYNCIDIQSITVENQESNITIETNVLTTPSCNAANGQVELAVSGFDGSYQVMINDSLWFENEEAATLLLENIAADTYSIEVSDELNCTQTANLTLLNGNSPLNLETEVFSMPNCEAANGSFQLFVSNFTEAYQVVINDSLWFENQEAATLLLDNLAVGNYNIVVKDNAGCIAESDVILESVESPALSLDDVIVKHLACPSDSSGGIESNLAYALLVFDNNENLLGETPITGLAAGDYLVQDTVSACPSELLVTINGVEDWSIESNITATTCAANDGAIDLLVNGANGGYTFAWTPAVSDSSSAINLMADSSYTVIITDSVGCSQTLENLFIPIECDTVVTECDPLFALDTFSVALTDSLTEICLPLNVLDTTGWTYVLDDTAYTQDLGTCIDSVVFYSYGMLLSIGEAPYRLDSWTYNGQILSDFEFNTIEELVAEMNSKDPTGNWLISESDNSISGGASGATYGNLQITHIEGQTTLTLQLNNVSQLRFSIHVAGAGQHLFVIEDGVCTDTLVINLLEESSERPEIFIEEFITLEADSCDGVAKLCLPIIGGDPFDFEILIDEDLFLGDFLDCNFDQPAIPIDTGFHEVIITDLVNLFSDTVLVNVMCDTLAPPFVTTDTIFVEIPLGETEEVCMDITELPGFILSVENTCEDPFNNVADVVLDIDQCVDIISYELGQEQACIVLCNELGFCDTTIVIIDVISDSLIIYNGFSPNGDGVNEHFRIDNIEAYPDNSLTIFNRWGGRVYRTESYQNRNGWTGTFADETILPDGTYFYILDDGEGQVYKGFLEIRR